MSLKILIITKNGKIEEENVKNINSDSDCLEKLYKKCGFKKIDDFIIHCEYTNPLDKSKIIKVIGKTTGRSNYENKYDFPPPIDNTLFFGSCALVAFDNDTSSYLNLTKKEWEIIYEALFGGFDNLDEKEETSEDELEGIDKKYLSDGYLLDGFVVENKRIGDDELSEETFNEIDNCFFTDDDSEDSEDDDGDDENEDDEDEEDSEGDDEGGDVVYDDELDADDSAVEYGEGGEIDYDDEDDEDDDSEEDEDDDEN
jgi:hypothetical protein